VKKFQVDVEWTFVGGQIIEAEDEEDARGVADLMPLSSFNGSFISGSFIVTTVEETDVDDDGPEAFGSHLFGDEAQDRR